MKAVNIKDRKKYYKAMEKHFLFKDCGNEFLIAALDDERAEWLAFDKGEALYSYDDFKNSLGIILKGTVSVNKNRYDNTVLLNYLKSGNVFGGAAVFGSSEQYVAALRAEVYCEVLFLPRELVSLMLKKSMTFVENYIGYLSNSLVFLNKRLDIFSAGSAEDRLKEYIRINAVMNKNGERELPNFSFSRLAEYLAIGRASLYRIMNDFEEKGLIKKEHKKIYIKGEL